MATWKEIKAQRQGKAPAASSPSSWAEIKKSRGYTALVNNEADTRRADAAGRQATIMENRNAPAPTVRKDEDGGIIPSVAERSAAAKASAKTAPSGTQNLAQLNRVGSVLTPEQIAEHFGVLDQYRNPDSRYTLNDDIRKYVDNLHKRTGGVEIENDRDYQWVKDSIQKGVPYNMARFGRLVGGGL